MAYMIELGRWGITQGLPIKRPEVINSVSVNCYADADYTLAYNNMMGFNNAFAWAKASGYNKVTVPFGIYSVCYSNISDKDYENKIVINFDNFSVDLNGSTFKVMYDSVKRSPYDKIKSGNIWITNTAPTYAFPGTMMVVRDCNFTEVKNGKIIGDKIDRDFTLPNERGIDNTYGILAGGNCKYINIEGHDVSLFMGDGVAVSSGKNNTFIKVGYDMKWVLGELDTNGSFIASNAHCVSDYISVSPNTPHFLQGYGYTQGLTALVSRRYTVYMYDANKSFLNKTTQFALKDFTTTKLTKFIRLVVEEISVDPNGWQMQLKTGYYGSYLTFQNNYIHHNHRGGMSPGVNDMFIINNHFYNNGEAYDYENNLPGAANTNGTPWTTRYHINMEDSQGFNIHIIGNKFENGRIGIAARGYNYVIRDNWFKNCGVVLYRMIYATVKDNYFEGPSAGFNTYPYDTPWNSYQDYIRYWDIEGNVIEGDFIVVGNATIKNISNNTIQGMVSLQCDVNNFRDNLFKIDKDIGFAEVINLKTVSNIYGCSFIKSNQSKAKNSITFENCTLYDCTFKNIKIQVDNNVVIKDSTITDLGFNIRGASLKLDSCKVSHGTYSLLNNYPINPENSAFINIITSTVPTSLELKNCDITSNSGQSIFSGYNAKSIPISSVKIEGTKIEKQLNNKLGFGMFGGTVSIIKSQISCDVKVPVYTPNPALTHQFSDNVFTNVSFNIKQSDIVYTQQDIGLLARPLSGNGVPSVVPQKLGQEYYDITNKKLYKSFGTTTTADWVLVN